jgi:hypothetical protein
MPLEPINLSQPDNDLSKIAERERNKLLPKNDYKKTAFEYSATNPDALANGDNLGRGTGNFLDRYNDAIGTTTDIKERRNQIVINEYKVNNPYTTPPA